jgi:uncharacterized radical SAM superfamily Fe-S cluster-containing enzyme
VDSDYVFHGLTRSICPSCKTVINARILLRDNKVYQSKRCPNCGPFMALVYDDAQAYVSFARFDKPGTIPLAYGTQHDMGCPHDCGLSFAQRRARPKMVRNYAAENARRWTFSAKLLAGVRIGFPVSRSGRKS